MKAISRLAFLRHASIGTLLVLTGICSTDAKEAGVVKSIPKGQRLYTKFTLYYEDLRHRTTNYRKGILVPVNTEVEFVRARGDNIIVKLPGGPELRIENIEPFSGESLDGIFNRTFSTEKVDLGQFTEDERKAILSGEATPGMRKSAVIVALGYPPKHKTPTLESSEWRYWRNRFNTFLVRFDDEKVADIKK